MDDALAPGWEMQAPIGASSKYESAVNPKAAQRTPNGEAQPMREPSLKR